MLRECHFRIDSSAVEMNVVLGILVERGFFVPADIFRYL